jgi:hypothetical protein
MPARHRVAQHEPREEVHEEREHRAVRHLRVPQAERVAEEHDRVGQVRHALRVRVDLRERERDVQRAERHDERRQLDTRDQHAVQEPEQRGGRDAAGDGEHRRQAEYHGEARHHDGAERHHHAAGKIDAARQYDERLTDRDHGDHHRLLENQRKILEREEAVALRDKERAREHEREERPDVGDGRQVVCEVMLARARRRRGWSRHDALLSGNDSGKNGKRHGAGAAYLLPQQFSSPNFESLLSTPDIGLSVMSVTPVS